MLTEENHPCGFSFPALLPRVLLTQGLELSEAELVRTNKQEAAANLHPPGAFLDFEV